MAASAGVVGIKDVFDPFMLNRVVLPEPVVKSDTLVLRPNTKIVTSTLNAGVTVAPSALSNNAAIGLRDPSVRVPYRPDFRSRMELAPSRWPCRCP
jgi:hypothetical protein